MYISGISLSLHVGQPASPLDGSAGTAWWAYTPRRSSSKGGKDLLGIFSSALRAAYIGIAIRHTPEKLKFLTAPSTFVFIYRHPTSPSVLNPPLILSIEPLLFKLGQLYILGIWKIILIKRGLLSLYKVTFPTCQDYTVIIRIGFFILLQLAG